MHAKPESVNAPNDTRIVRDSIRPNNLRTIRDLRFRVGAVK